MEVCNSYIEWHTEQIPGDLFPNYDTDRADDLEFGILRVITPKMPICQKPLAILFSIDNSCSMDNKIKYVKHTMKNMLNVCMKKIEEHPDLPIYICMDLFSHEVVNIFKTPSVKDFLANNPDSIVMIDDFVQLTAKSIEFLLNQVDAICPWGCTNIEKSLRNANQKLRDIKTKIPDLRVVHIQLTDGEATAGERTPQELKQHIDYSYSNIFVGYGKDHDSYLLSTLGDLDPKFDYRFVDVMEHTGLIYGELLYHILYPVDDRPIEIRCSKCKIYDYKTSTWVDSITVPPLCGDSEKVYHVCTDRIITKPNVFAELYFCGSSDVSGAVLFDTANSLPPLYRMKPNLECDESDILPVDLTKYLLRQRTQECLALVREYENYKVKDYMQRLHPEIAEETPSHLPNMTLDEITRMLDDNLSLLTKYKTDQNTVICESDLLFIQTLIEDLQSAKEKIGTSEGLMYTAARQTSQGRQHSYTPSSSIRHGHDLTQYTNNGMFNMMSQVDNDPSFNLTLPTRYNRLSRTTNLLDDLAPGYYTSGDEDNNDEDDIFDADTVVEDCMPTNNVVSEEMSSTMMTQPQQGENVPIPRTVAYDENIHSPCTIV
jgi:hypothetical protein